MKISRIVQWLVGIVLAGAGLWIFFKNVNGHTLVNQLTRTNPLVIIACAVLSVGSIWIRSIRARLLLPHCNKSQQKMLFPIIMIGFMINNILPARMGEAARAMLMWKRNGYSGAISVGSLVLERILDSIVFLSCFFVPVFFVHSLSSNSINASARSVTLYSLATLFCAIFFATILFLVLYSRFPQAIKKWGTKIGTFLPKKISQKIGAIASELMSNLDWTFSFWRVAGVIVLSYAIVLCYAMITILLVNEASFGVLHGLFAQAFAAFGAAIPLAPGYVGTLHAVYFQGLALCGIEHEKAGAVTILFHAIPYITITAAGLYFFFKANITFKDIAQAKSSIDNEESKELSQ